MLGRKKVNKNSDEEETLLQKLLSNPVYDMFMLSVILLNCVAMCVADPTLNDDEQEEWIQSLGWFFNVSGSIRRQ
jgi:hypothetical protein